MNSMNGLDTTNAAEPQSETSNAMNVTQGRLRIQVRSKLIDQQDQCFCAVCTCKCSVCVSRCRPI